MFRSRLAALSLMFVMALTGAETSTASAGSIAALARFDTARVETSTPEIIPVAHRGKHRLKYRTQHRHFHSRYRPHQRHFDRAHRRFHRHVGRPHRGPVYYGWYWDYYDPFFYDPYFYDPYYYYTTRITCDSARRLLRGHGYRNVKAYDCRGKTYGFQATKGKKRYRITVDARNGQIISRKRS